MPRAGAFCNYMVSQWYRHGSVPPARRSGAGTGEWRPHGRVRVRVTPSARQSWPLAVLMVTPCLMMITPHLLTLLIFALTALAVSPWACQNHPMKSGVLSLLVVMISLDQVLLFALRPCSSAHYSYLQWLLQSLVQASAQSHLES